MRWVILASVALVPAVAASADCRHNPSIYVDCPQQEIISTLAQWPQPSYLLPPDDGGTDAHAEWDLQRTSDDDSNKLQMPKVQLGGWGPSVSIRRKREIVLTQDCWKLTLRAFSKVELFCSSSF